LIVDRSSNLAISIHTREAISHLCLLYISSVSSPDLIGMLRNYIEGPWDDVLRVIGQAHSLLHEKGIVRIQTDIRVGSRYAFILLCQLLLMMAVLMPYRIDKKQTSEDKVRKVEELLTADAEGNA